MISNAQMVEIVTIKSFFLGAITYRPSFLLLVLLKRSRLRLFLDLMNLPQTPCDQHTVCVSLRALQS